MILNRFWAFYLKFSVSSSLIAVRFTVNFGFFLVGLQLGNQFLGRIENTVRLYGAHVTSGGLFVVG